MKRKTFSDAFQSAVESVVVALRTLGKCGLFPHFSPADADAVIKLLLEHVRKERLDLPWQLVPSLVPVLNEWARTLNRPLPPGLLLVTQSTAIRSISVDIWIDPDDEEDKDGAEPAGNGEPLASDNPLAGKSSLEIVQSLISQLKEPSSQLSLFRKLVDTHGAGGVWELLQATNKALQEKSPVTRAMDGRARTAGGVFIKLARERDAQLKSLDAEQKKLESLPEGSGTFQLRDYQLAAVGCIREQGGNWVVAAPTNTGKTAIFIEISKLMLRANPSSKTLVLVPTVSLAAQHCCSFLKAGFAGPATTHPLEPPPVPFLLGPPGAGGPGVGRRPRVDCFFSEHPLRPECWEEELGRLSVLVIEAGSFRNLLASGTARLDQLDLLVLDECHHALKQHPYAVIMKEYRPDLGKPQVLGFSASPAGGNTVDKVKENLAGLLQRLHASLHIVSAEQVEVIAPAPSVEELYFSGRDEDGAVRQQLLDALVAVALRIGRDLQGLLGEEGEGPGEGAGAGAGLDSRTALELAASVQALRAAVLAGGPVEQYNLLCTWARKARELAAGWGMRGWGLGMGLFEVLRRCSELAADVGQECALQTLGCQLQHLAARGGAAAARAAAAAARSAAAAATAAAAAPSAAASAPACVSGASSPCSPSLSLSLSLSPTSSTASGAAGGSSGGGSPLPLAALVQHVRTGPRARDIARAHRRAKRVAAPRPPTDTATSVLELCRMVLRGLPFLGDGSEEEAALQLSASSAPTSAAPVRAAAPAPAAAPAAAARRALALALVDEAVGAVVPGRLRPPPACSPKIWHLVCFLQRYAAAPSLHGIIFSRMQQGAHYLAEVLRAASQTTDAAATDSAGGASGTGAGARAVASVASALPPPPLFFIDSVHVLVGHGDSVQRKAPPPSSPSSRSPAPMHHGSHISAKGMSASRQQSVLEQFKAPGRRLLVATNAAEEGLDIPCCEFVVRFTPAASGIQLVQAKGRGRKLGSSYFCLVQSGFGFDEKLHLKSTQEEDAMKQALAGLVQGGSA